MWSVIEARSLALTIAAAVALGAMPMSGSQVERSSATLRPGDHSFSLQHGGRRRSYVVHVPRAVAAARALPLVVAFHGGGGDADTFKAYSGFDARSDRESFIVVYPNGTGVLPRRLLTWNAGECCGYGMNQGVDDVGFAIAVLDDVARRTAVDSRRVFATGHSNGAMMAYRLAAARADRLVAIAPVAGAYDLETFAPSRRVSVLHIHSVDDPRALYEGGLGPPFPGTNVRASHRPVTEGLERWRRHNGCAPQARAVETRAGVAPTGGTRQTATLLEWERCADTVRLAHWKLTGAGHGWPGHTGATAREGLIGPATTVISAAEEIWKFFAPLHR